MPESQKLPLTPAEIRELAKTFQLILGRKTLILSDDFDELEWFDYEGLEN